MILVMMKLLLALTIGAKKGEKMNKNNERTTLRHFLDIVGKSFIMTYCCGVYIKHYVDEFWGIQEDRVKFNGKDFIQSFDDLKPYLDYEIYGFDQILDYGEIDEQIIWLREM